MNSFSTVFANTVYSLGKRSDPIITFLLSFCLSTILGFWKGPFRGWGPFYLILKAFKPTPPLLNGWERAGLGFLWVTQLAMEPSLLHIQCGFDDRPAPWLHPYTRSAYCHAKQQLLLQSGTISHRSLEEPPFFLLALLCSRATNACNFCANEERRLWANTPLSAIIGFSPYGGRKICNCDPLGNSGRDKVIEGAGWEGWGG